MLMLLRLLGGAWERRWVWTGGGRYFVCERDGENAEKTGNDDPDLDLEFEMVMRRRALTTRMQGEAMLLLEGSSA